MKKFLCTILSLFLTLGVALSIVGCDKTDEMQSKLASLEAQIAEQTQEIKDLQTENDKLQADLAETIVINQTLSSEVQDVEKKFYNSLFGDMWMNHDLSEEQKIPEYDIAYQYVAITVALKKFVTDTNPEYDSRELFDKFRIFAPDKIVNAIATCSLPPDFPLDTELAKKFRPYVSLKLDNCTFDEAREICRKIMLLEFVYMAAVQHPYTAMPEV